MNVFPIQFWFTFICRCSTVSGDNFVCILRHSSLVWHQSTWPSYDSWVMIMRQRNSATVWKLVQMVVSSYGKEFQGASVTVIRKFVIVRMDSLFKGIWLSTFLVGIGKSWSWGLLAVYGKKNKKWKDDECLIRWLYSKSMGLLHVAMSEALIILIRVSLCV